MQTIENKQTQNDPFASSKQPINKTDLLGKARVELSALAADMSRTASILSEPEMIIRGSQWSRRIQEIATQVHPNKSALPEIVEASQWLETPAELPEEIISGFLHRGSKATIGGASKTFKTWTLIDLAIAVSTERKWWGMQTLKSKVLYLNFELQAPFFQHRIRTMIEKRGASPDVGQLMVWNLRGYVTDFSTLLPEVIRRIQNEGFGLIVIDPLYCGLGDRDENAAGDMNSLMNEIEKVAFNCNSAVIFASHFSKGNQAGKDHADRISGSGVIGRNPEAILTMTAHKEDGCFTVESMLRNLPPVKPFVVRWNFPCFERDEDADPTELKQPGRPNKHIPTKEEYLSLFPYKWEKKPEEAALSASDIRDMFESRGWSRGCEISIRLDLISSGSLSQIPGKRFNSKLFARPEIAKLIKE